MTGPADPKAAPRVFPTFTPPTWALFLDDIARGLRQASTGPNGKRLLAMGDSWFNYLPHYDVIWWLKAKYQFACDPVAIIGEKLIHMAPPDSWDPRNPKPLPIGTKGHQLADLAIQMRDLEGDDKEAVSAVLISGGGNDIAGDWKVLASLLNDASAGPPHINKGAFDEIVDGQLRETLADVLQATIDLTGIYFDDRVVPIFIHGYAWPVPDGRPGPLSDWLKSAFDARHYTNLQQCTAIMKCLIDRLNAIELDVISKLSTPKGIARVHHVDLRPVLRNDLTDDIYQADWQNELHPTIPAGFEKVADAFARALGVVAVAKGGVAAGMKR